MLILIEHPEHGRMHVYSESELKRHETQGWRKVRDKTENTVVRLVEPTKRKRGRPAGR